MLKTQFHPAHKGGSKALMIVLHGLGDSIAGYQWLPSALGLPWMNYLLVNAPDSYYGGFSWFDFAGDYAPGVLRSRKLLFDLLDAQRANGHPPREITLFGFSQGSLMTIDVGLRYPHRLAGLVGISGAIFEPEKLLKEASGAGMAMQQRLLITHGTDDPIIPFHHTAPQVKALISAGLQIEWHQLAKEHTIAGEDEIDLIRKFVEAGYEPRKS
jgi:phospholipase/carboxylesterase